jgi:ribonuclease HII
MKILGIDEAGRGPVIGPLVMCGYLIDEKHIAKLRNMGVKDSKMLTPKIREFLLPKIKKLCDDFIILKASAKDIDKLRTESNLNKLEIGRMQHIINLLEPDRVVIDAIEANTKKFHSKVSSKIKNKGIEIVAENFADKKYHEVGAASIIAKVNRDKEISKLHKLYGNFGSGYTSDERTIKFLKDWIKMNKEFPDIVRRSWITAIELKKQKEQRTLGSFVFDND